MCRCRVNTSFQWGTDPWLVLHLWQQGCCIIICKQFCVSTILEAFGCPDLRHIFIHFELTAKVKWLQFLICRQNTGEDPSQLQGETSFIIVVWRHSFIATLPSQNALGWASFASTTVSCVNGPRDTPGIKCSRYTIGWNILEIVACRKYSQYQVHLYRNELLPVVERWTVALEGNLRYMN